MPRAAIRESIKREVLTEAGFRCAVPTCRTILAIDLHHIVEVSDKGSNEAHNLLALCPTCHALHHRGIIPKESIKVWKGMLVSLNGAFDKATIDDLLFLYKTSQSLVLSGDGILKFSKLIAANLAVYTQFFGYGSHINYQVFLTDRGRLLVEAWEKGNIEELKKYL
ncbi:MAG: HNH endonuclease [Sediminibacterium sp.]|jgi:hypothetical protein|nr:HNH endonuclease [Sediminibacterium sp.]